MARRDNEIRVIGSILIDPQCIVECDSIGLNVDDFDDSTSRLAFQAIDEIRQDGGVLDPVVIASHMSGITPGDYSEWLYDTMVVTTTAANMGAYCQLVRDGARRQVFINALMDSATAANYGDWQTEAAHIYEMLQTLKGKDAGIITGQDLSKSWLDYYDQVKEDPEAAFCRTGFVDLDRQLGGGMFKSEVYIVGARPGMGKTTLAINIAQNIVNRGEAVLFVSLEMSEQQIQAKRISLETKLPYTKLMTGRISGQDEQIMMAWLKDQQTAPFYLTTRSLTVGEIGRHARQVPKLAAIVVDYIGLISCSEESRQKPRYEQMTEISASLKAMAKLMRIPVLALCQLNRENTTRGDKRPTMADLRDSGAIEQDAGAIILLHRPEYYEQHEENEERPELEQIELNVAKNRHAETGLVRMWWSGNYGKLMQLSAREEPAPNKINREEALPF